MEMNSVACNNCGAPLHVPETTRFVTCNHCGSQLAIKRDEHITYTEKIDRIDARTEQMQTELERLRVDSALAQLDRDWDRQREDYMITAKDGQRTLPTTAGSIFGGVVIVIFGLLWTSMAASMTGGFGGSSIVSLFPLFGLLFIAFGIGVSFYSYTKAKDYLAAERDYRRRRSALLRDGRANDR